MIFKKPNRAVRTVFIHCSASDHAHHDNIETIRKWHIEERGWTDIGYHFFITKDGKIHEGRDTNAIPAAQKNHNWGSIAICLSGEKGFSEEQRLSLIELCKEIYTAYDGQDITFHGHCEVSDKTCPNFDYKDWLALDAMGRINPLLFLKGRQKQSFLKKLVNAIRYLIKGEM